MTGRIRNEITVFLLAVQFLTRVPVRIGSGFTAARLAAAVRYYPVVGVGVGSAAALVYWAAIHWYTPVIAALLSTAATILLTGAFHEDGLADAADGIGGGSTKDRALEIMKDSRLGAFGALALGLTLAIKIAALTAMGGGTVLVALIAAHGLSRLSSVLAIATSDYVREAGTGKPTAGGVGTAGIGVAIVTGAACLAAVYLLVSPAGALWALAGMAVAHVATRLFYERKLGGYTGDCLGATQQISEVAIYLGLLL